MFDENNMMALISDDHEQQEFFPILSQQEEDDMNSQEVPDVLPILPIRNTILFPGVVFPITVGRDKSIRLIKEANKGNRTIGVFGQINPEEEDPDFNAIHHTGTVAFIIKILRMPDGNTTAIIQGKRRIAITEHISDEPYMTAKVATADEVKNHGDKEFKALISTIKDLSLRIIELSPHIPSEAAIAIKNIDSTSFLVNFVAGNLNIGIVEKQRLLELHSIKARAQVVLDFLAKEIQMLELKDKIHSKVRFDIDKQQKEYFLQQQIRAIQEELGNETPDKEVENLKAKGKRKKWSKAVQKAFDKELEKLLRINPSSPEYSVSLNYVQLMLDLPWDHYTGDKFDIKSAQKQLDKDHFGLEKVKKRILEYLAVLKLKGDMKSPILCLVGPPGVGKTSLGKSIAKAIGRKYVRMSLGGLHDESEIRGHRKTYIGAMPGRILQNLKKAETSNPVFVLDELDKLGHDFKGDPSSALLEVLDPEQNNTFHDNYLDLDYDLSKVMFVATANSLDTIQHALLDRMEIIEISGYTVEEKIQIAQKYLIPKQRRNHGLSASDLKINPQVLELLIEEYTRESGVRGLDKKLASLARHNAKLLAMEEPFQPVIGKELLHRILGNEKIEKEIYEGNDVAGLATGLAWSPVGGSILYVESALSRGSGKITLTGKIGEVMRESATTALTYLKSHCDAFGIDHRVFHHWDIHIHFPAGAIPKDGPSAGITILTALASLFTQRKVKPHIALTGEITLRGNVLPVGGIKEKILAAKRAGIKEIIMCTSNKSDVEDITESYLKGLTFHYVKTMKEVLDISITSEEVSLPKDLLKPISEEDKKNNT
jgi:ATP-dependent Lon protease